MFSPRLGFIAIPHSPGWAVLSVGCLLALAAVAGKATAIPAATATTGASVPPVRVKYKVSDPEWKEFPPRTPAMLNGFTPAAFPEPKRNRWGGYVDEAGQRQPATGFFRVKKEQDRWWLIDPDGGRFLHVGVAAVDPGRTPAAQSVLQQRFGTPEQWAQQTSNYLRELGFNGTGSWSRAGLLRTVPKQRLVYTVIGNAGAPDGGNAGGFMSSFGKKLRATRPGVGHTNYPNHCIPVFHPDFAAHCEEFARPLAGLKDDPYLLGYFSDNELPYPRLENYLALSTEDPAMASSQRAAQNWLEARRGKGTPITELTDAEKDAFAEHVWERYLALTTAAIRKADPNHLCLGPRFYGPEKDKPGVFRVAGRYLDAIGVNLYFVWSPKPGEIGRWTEWSSKPVLITEWYAKGMDAGLANTSGAGWTVPTQRDRGLFYQTFTLGLLEARNCVGWHWFKYLDNDPNDPNAEASNRDANKGMVNGRYEPYAPLAESMRILNQRVYSLAAYFDQK